MTSPAHKDEELLPCLHPKLHFGSGDYHLFCNDCNQTWTVTDHMKANRGEARLLSGQVRQAASAASIERVEVAGKPAAWIFDGLEKGEWRPRISRGKPILNNEVRNVEPLGRYAAPLRSEGVQRSEVAQAKTDCGMNLARVFAITNLTEKHDVAFFLSQWADCQNADERVRLIRSFRNQMINAGAGEALSLPSAQRLCPTCNRADNINCSDAVRRDFLQFLQTENQCTCIFGTPCDSKKCGCAIEMQEYIDKASAPSSQNGNTP
ncbi:MAG: hypothetical protein NVS3B5_21130 [Sphingomicrobium sp.]